MRSTLDEYLSLSLPIVIDNDKALIAEIVATFETAREVATISFGKSDDISDAISIMEDLLYNRMVQRRKFLIVSRLIAVSAVAIILIVSLFVLIY